MTNAELLAAYAAGPDILEERLAGVDAATLAKRPDRPDGWSIKEHAIHLIDSDLNGFVRIKSIVAQPGTACYVMDEELWTANLRRTDEDLGRYLRLFRLEREIIAELVRPLLGSCDGFFLRTYKGEERRIDLRGALEVYVKHLEFHLPYIDALRKG